MHKTVAIIITTRYVRDNLIQDAFASALDQTEHANEIFIAGRLNQTLPECLERVNDIVKNMASSHFILLNDDDRLHRDFIKETAAHDADIVYTAMRIFGDMEQVVPCRPWGDNIRQDTAPWVTSLISKDIFLQVGGYDPMPFYDWNFYWKAYDAGATAKTVNQPLFMHRSHPGQHSHEIDWQAERERVMKARGAI